MSQKSIVVILDGIDGSGKSTLAPDVQRNLQMLGRKAWFYRDPGGTDVGEKIRTLVKSASVPMHAHTQFLLFCAARAELTAKINEHLAANEDVVLDRWWYSTYCYQGASGISRRHIEDISSEFSELVFNDVDEFESLEGGRLSAYHLHVSPSVSRERIAFVNRITDVKHDRFESKPPDFQQRVYEGYLDLEQRGLMQRIETNGRTLDEVRVALISKVYDQVARHGQA